MHDIIKYHAFFNLPYFSIHKPKCAVHKTQNVLPNINFILVYKLKL